MKIIVCAKICDGEINIFDKSAVECALRLSDDVTVISMGPETAKAPLRELTRLGARVILLSDSVFAGSDTLITSSVLSAAIRKFDYDLVICGRQTTDGDTAQVGPSLSVRLGVPVVTNVLEIISVDSRISCRTRSGEKQVNLPAVITVEKIHSLRFPRLRSKEQEITVWNHKELGLSSEQCGLSASPTQVLKVFENKSGTRQCKWIQKDELFALINQLKDAETKEIEEEISPVKLKNVWIIGREVQKVAAAIGETVTLIDEKDPFKIVAKIQAEKPDVVLWNADLWGRENAPVAATVLETGLCADCVKLETDGETLFMYRPAKSGNITAKIKCKTKPQMATVRTVLPSSAIIVSAGRGVQTELAAVEALAESLGAELCASRGLVDSANLPMEMQIGLTGKTVSPKIYLAIGISGAVHHTCAIENAGTVIAINPDKNARIFEYADYGIVDTFPFVK